MLDAGNGQVAPRPPAGGDQDVFRRHRPVLGEKAHAVRALEHGAAVDDLGAGLFEIADVDAAQPRHLAGDIADERRPVEMQALDPPAEADRILEGFGIVGGVDEQLLGHAAAQHAGAADAAFLGDRHALAQLGGQARGTDAGRAGADDHQVVVVAARHARQPIKADGPASSALPWSCREARHRPGRTRPARPAACRGRRPARPSGTSGRQGS